MFGNGDNGGRLEVWMFGSLATAYGKSLVFAKPPNFQTSVPPLLIIFPEIDTINSVENKRRGKCI